MRKTVETEQKQDIHRYDETANKIIKELKDISENIVEVGVNSGKQTCLQAILNNLKENIN